MTSVHFALDERIFQKECTSLAKEGYENILEVAMVVVDGEWIKAGQWYGIDFTERQVAEL